jgi:hypothetical protein
LRRLRGVSRRSRSSECISGNIVVALPS